ncbi:peptidoglycan-binding protein [Streptomyces sp. NPDC059262]|uniref:peptidoglycan-binding protein n=1 Tax=Streptomyces sp. NPDC059262 TaxID=3346797 RepID=UPI0036C88694
MHADTQGGRRNPLPGEHAPPPRDAAARGRLHVEAANCCAELGVLSLEEEDASGFKGRSIRARAIASVSARHQRPATQHSAAPAVARRYSRISSRGQHWPRRRHRGQCPKNQGTLAQLGAGFRTRLRSRDQGGSGILLICPRYACHRPSRHRGRVRDYTTGPGPEWTDTDRRPYAAWQHKIGLSASDADGIPGRQSWDRLHVPATSGAGGRVSSPVPGHTVTTLYYKKGPHWSLGYHTGADYAAPKGSSCVATPSWS